MAERDFEVGSFYWVRLYGSWSVAERVTNSAQACWACMASEVLQPDEFWDEIGPHVGKEPAEAATFVMAAPGVSDGTEADQMLGGRLVPGCEVVRFSGIEWHEHVGREPGPFSPSVEIEDGGTRLHFKPKADMTPAEMAYLFVALKSIEWDGHCQKGSVIAWLAERNLLRHFEAVT